MADIDAPLAWRMQQDGYLMQINKLRDEKTALERRIDELRTEIEHLHADRVHWELGNCPNCPNVVSLQEVLEQNTKLRKLFSSYWKAVHCPVTPNVPRDYLAEMRKLKVEVD